MSTRWKRRALAALLGFTVLYLVTVLVDFEPDALRLALVVALAVAGAGLLLDALADSGASWHLDAARPVLPQGQDPATARYRSLLESHVASASPDAGVRDRFASLAELVLRQRHGIDLSDPGAAARLGPELAAFLAAPPRRLSRREIERHLQRIEEL